MTTALRRLEGPLALLLALALWAGACLFAGAAAPLGERAALQIGGAPAGVPAAREMAAAEARTEHPLAFTLWRQEDGQTVESPALGRERTVSVLTLWGESALLLPDARPSLAPAAGNGCLIDRTTALSLFGDARAEGQKVRWNGRDYTVRGVFDAPEATLAVEADPASEVLFDRVTLDLSGEENPRGRAEEFAMRHGLPGERIVQYGGLAALARFFCLLPALAAACSLAVRFFGRARARRDWPVQRALLWIAAVAAAAAVLWLAGVRPAVPQDSIPTRWSDFSFWETLFTERRAEWTDYLWMKKERPDVLLLTALLKAAACSLAALLLAARPALRRPAADPRDFAFLLAACLCGSFAGVALVGGGELLARDLPMLWLTAPLWLAARRAAEKIPD